MNNTTRFVLLGALMLTLVGCGQKMKEEAVEEVAEQANESSIIEESLEESADGTVDVDISDDSFTIETEEGSFAVNGDEENGSFSIETDEVNISGGSTDELPEDWPEDVPLANGLTVTTAVTQGDSARSVAVEAMGGDAKALFEEMKALLEKNGWDESSTITSGSLYGYTAKKDDRLVSVSLNDEPDEEKVTGAISVGTGL